MIKNIYTTKPKTMQLNITKKCNMSCYHCHVGANPKQNEMMSEEVFLASLEVFKKFGFEILDFTGGAPEIHKSLEKMLKMASKIAKTIIVRSNLTILLEKDYAKFLEIFKKYKVCVVASVPFYEKDFNDAMRGCGSFEKEIKALGLLNSLGFGDKLKLNLVYNPNGAYLPPNQSELEQIYKEKLSKFGIRFNNLYCMANLPIGNFKKILVKFDEFDEYLDMLKENYELENLENLMCKSLLNVWHDGSVYDCDFNGALGLKNSLNKNIFELLECEKIDRVIATNEHCYACLAGAGYGCYGS